MVEVVLYHHVQGLTEGLRSFATLLLTRVLAFLDDVRSSPN